MTFEETVHYDVDKPESQAEWSLLYPLWSHGGYVHLNSDQQQFEVAMYHQLHCLQSIVEALRTQHVDEPWHLKHCFDYLRQLFICSADTTLESFDFVEQDFLTHPVSITRQCQDWSAVISYVELLHEQWLHANSRPSNRSNSG